jgi:hypothetical protein
MKRKRNGLVVEPSWEKAVIAARVYSTDTRRWVEAGTFFTPRLLDTSS